MNRHSLRLRLVTGGIVAILIALATAGGALVVVFERHVSRTLAQDLDVHLKQLLAGVDIDPQGMLVLTQTPVDPRFADPLSGLYWQVGDDRGQLLRSRSLRIWRGSRRLPRRSPRISRSRSSFSVACWPLPLGSKSASACVRCLRCEAE
jgi:hypothetical protein